MRPSQGEGQKGGGATNDPIKIGRADTDVSDGPGSIGFSFEWARREQEEEVPRGRRRAAGLTEAWLSWIYTVSSPLLSITRLRPYALAKYNNRSAFAKRTLVLHSSWNRDTATPKLAVIWKQQPDSYTILLF